VDPWPDFFMQGVQYAPEPRPSGSGWNFDKVDNLRR
jgi:hypothetical protein